MFSHIFHYEWLRQTRSKTQPLLLCVACVLLLATTYTHWRQHIILSEARAHWQKTSDELWAKQPDRHPHRVAHYGHVVVRPQAPLSFIEPGVSPYVGNYLFLEAHRQNSSAVRSSAINPVMLKMGYPSVASIMLVMWPLLLIVLGYGVFSNEWDSGRLFWLSSMGTSVWQLFAGKMATLASYTLVLLVVLGVVSGILVGFSSGISTRVVKDLIVLLCLYAGYSLFWLVLILAISFYSRNSQQSLWRLLTLWLLVCIVIPKAATGVAETVYPTPDRANFDAMVEESVHAVGDAHNPDDPYFSEFRSKVLAQYGVERIEDLPVNWNGILMAEGERITSEIFQQHYDAVLAQFSAQDRLRLWFGFVSPVLAIQHVSQKIARTDRESSQHFEAAAEVFRYDLIQRLNHLHSYEIERARDKSQRLSSDVWKEMALFQYTPPQTISAQRLSLVVLFVWGLLAMYLTFRFWRGEVSR